MSWTNQTVVLDCSVIVKWYLRGEVLDEQSSYLLQQFETGALNVVAPDHIRCEVASAIAAATYGQSQRIAVADGETAITNFLSLEIITVQTLDLILGAYHLSHQHRVSVYDALYLELARQYSIPLVTADSRFYRKVRNDHDVRWLGDLPIN